MSQNATPSSSPVQNHTRVINSVIGVAEKKVLLWLAARMPAWVVPDTLTMIGLLASVMIFVAYALTYYNQAFLWLASLGFVINWFGDSLDGTLARYRKIERPRYGFFVDHIIDSISVVMVLIGLGISPYLRFDLALLMLVAYLLASIYVYLTTYVNGVFRISYGGLGPTEMRMIAIAVNTIVFFAGNPLFALPFVQLTLYDMSIGVIILVIVTLFLYNTIQTAMSLSREDRLARQAKAREERAARAARRQALRNERTMRRQMAKSARSPRIRLLID